MRVLFVFDGVVDEERPPADLFFDPVEQGAVACVLAFVFLVALAYDVDCWVVVLVSESYCWIIYIDDGYVWGVHRLDEIIYGLADQVSMEADAVLLKILEHDVVPWVRFLWEAQSSDDPARFHECDPGVVFIDAQAHHPRPFHPFELVLFW